MAQPTPPDRLDLLRTALQEEMRAELILIQVPVGASVTVSVSGHPAAPFAVFPAATPTAGA